MSEITATEVTKSTTEIATDAETEALWGNAENGMLLREDLESLLQHMTDEIFEVREALSTRGTPEDLREAIVDALQHCNEIKGWAEAAAEELETRVGRFDVDT